MGHIIGKLSTCDNCKQPQLSTNVVVVEWDDDATGDRERLCEPCFKKEYVCLSCQEKKTEIGMTRFYVRPKKCVLNCDIDYDYYS